MKVCNTCGKTRALCEFHKAGGGKRRADCKDCRANGNARTNPKGNAVSRLAYTLVGGSRAFYDMPTGERASVRQQAMELYEAGRDFVSAANARQVRQDGFVYVIGHPRLLGVKIGRAFDPESRLRSYQTGCPHREYKLHFVSKYSSDCVALERQVHKALDTRRMDGEWFNVYVEEAIRAINAVQTGGEV
jgi:hypothetical protein